MPKAEKTLALSSLASGQPGLSKAKADQLAEAAAVCLQHNRHRNGVRLTVSGSAPCDLRLEFKRAAKAAVRSNADLIEAVEDGATAIAIGVITRTTKYRVVERAIISTGFDWWLGEQDGVLSARLEVSGILKGKNRVTARVNKKLAQMNPTDDSNLPGFAAVVEFSEPQARIERKP